MPAANDLSGSSASHIGILEVYPYLPPGVSKIIGGGGESFIGVTDESTVLKYPCIPSNRESFQMEAQLLDVLGSHPRIIDSKGLTEHGLVDGRTLLDGLSRECSKSFRPRVHGGLCGCAD